MIRARHQFTLFTLVLAAFGLVLLAQSPTAVSALALKTRATNRFNYCIDAVVDYDDSFPGGNESAGSEVCSEDISTNIATQSQGPANSAVMPQSEIAVFTDVVAAARTAPESCFQAVADCLLVNTGASAVNCYPKDVCPTDEDGVLQARDVLEERGSNRQSCLALCYTLNSPPRVVGASWKVILAQVGVQVLGGVCTAYCNTLSN